MKPLPLPLLIDKYEKNHEPLKDFEQWTEDDLKLLLKYIKDELKSRKETRPFWV